MGLGGTGTHWEVLGGTGRGWEGRWRFSGGSCRVVRVDRVAETGPVLELGGPWGTGRDWEALGGTGRHWEGLEGHWEGLRGTGRDWEGLGRQVGVLQQLL